MKRIVFVGPPFSGHLHPLIGIARHLAPKADVRVVSTPGGVRDARASGIRGHAILAREESMVWNIAEPQRDVRNHPLLLWRQLKANVGLMGTMKRELDSLLADLRPDLVIADFVVPVAGLSASGLGIPWWTTLVSPCVFETPDGPPAYFGGQRPARSPLRAGLHAGMRHATRLFKRTLAFMLRAPLRDMGFERVYLSDGSEAVYSPDRVLALGIREIEFARSYPDHFDFVGPVLHTPPVESAEPEFPDDGRPTVLVTLGTHLPHAKAAFAGRIRRIAAARPQIVFHFTFGKSHSVESTADGSFRAYDYLSYERHLGRYDAVVHHAGTGIMYHCLRHGIPAVTHPVDYDQFDNAARLVEAGVAVPGDRSEDLEAAILRALSDRELRERCREMSRIQAGYRAEERIEALIDAACDRPRRH